MPEVSVLMGIYNEPDRERVKRAIDSILDQTYSDLEFIICDDGSKPSFFLWLKEYCKKDERIRLLRNKTNGGLAKALNTCIDHASGKYLARMDADDYSAKDRIEKQISYLETHPGAAFVGCNVWLTDRKGIWGKRKVETRPTKKSFLFTSPFVHPTVIFRREALQDAGGYSEDKGVLRTEDYELFMRLYAKGHAGNNLQECLFYYYEDPQVLSKRKYRYRINECKVRYQGFRELGILQGNIRYVIKPMVVGMIPGRVLQGIHRRRNAIANKKNPQTETYLQKRPYRRRKECEKWMLDLMETRFQRGFTDYWEQFGYEIGGPVCYAFTKWIYETVKSQPEIKDIVFVARDGWLLKKIYEKLDDSGRKTTHYLYANRTILKHSRDKKWNAGYKKYIADQGFSGEKIACVDSVANTFSAQRLLSMFSEQEIVGLYWLANTWKSKEQDGAEYKSFQQERYNVLYNWNIMEYIMTSGERPVKDITESGPVYFDGNSFEAKRITDFSKMEKGILDFVEDLSQELGHFPDIQEKTIRSWLNDYLRYPGQEDVRAFEKVIFSTNEQHSKEVRLKPFDRIGILKEVLKIRLKSMVVK